MGFFSGTKFETDANSLKKNYTCVKCGCDEAITHAVMMNNGSFGIGNIRFDTNRFICLVCSKCGYSEFYAEQINN